MLISMFKSIDWIEVYRIKSADSKNLRNLMNYLCGQLMELFPSLPQLVERASLTINYTEIICLSSKKNVINCVT